MLFVRIFFSNNMLWNNTKWADVDGVGTGNGDEDEKEATRREEKQVRRNEGEECETPHMMRIIISTINLSLSARNIMFIIKWSK